MKTKTVMVKAKVLNAELANPRKFKIAILELGADSEDDEYEVHKHIPSPLLIEIKGSEEIVLDEIRIPSKSTRGIIGKIKSVRYPNGKKVEHLNVEDFIELEVEITDYEFLGLK